MLRRSLFVFLCFAAIACADDQKAQKGPDASKSKIVPKIKEAKEGTYYNFGQVGVKDMEVKGSTINLIFKPIDEQFYWCPGIKVDKVEAENSKKKVTVVTFVRCKTSQDASVDKQAKIGKRLIRTVSFDTGGLDVYVREGEKFRRIHKSPAVEPQPKPANKKGAKKGKTKKKKAGVRRPSLTLYPASENAAAGRVPNYHYQKKSN